MRATMTPGENGRRVIDIEGQKVSAKDLMLAMRIGNDQYEPDLPLSGRIRADIGPDGIPRMVDGRIVVEKGVINDLEDPDASIPIDRAELSLDWDATRRALLDAVPRALGRQSHHADGAGRGAARSRWSMGTETFRRHHRAGRGSGGRGRRARPQPHSAAPAHRSRAPAGRYRAGRGWEPGAGGCALRQPRFLDRRSAAGDWGYRHPHAGGVHEAAVAGDRCAEGSLLGGGAHSRRHGRAAHDHHQCTLVDAQVERPPGSRRWSGDRDRRTRRRYQAGRRLARHP